MNIKNISAESGEKMASALKVSVGSISFMRSTWNDINFGKCGVVFDTAVGPYTCDRLRLFADDKKKPKRIIASVTGQYGEYNCGPSR